METRRPRTAPYSRAASRASASSTYASNATRRSERASSIPEGRQSTYASRPAAKMATKSSPSAARRARARPKTASAVQKKTRVVPGAKAAGVSKTRGGKLEWGRINVFVRGRPLSKGELEANAFDCLEVADARTVLLHEFCASDDYLRMKRLKTRQYGVDHVFGTFDSQRHVYEATTAPLVESVLQGQNASCFCYGATGTGKTHTMLGSVNDPGVMVLAFQNLFSQISQGTEVTMTYVEIYNETLRDLLNPNGGSLDLRELPGRGVTVSGVKEVKAASADEVVKLLHQGNKFRRTESTRCNQTSSRSHALLQIRIARREGPKVVKGKLSLVDLAGSERTLATEKKRSCRSIEGANINKSLLALSSCIRSLVEGKSHIPFRNSKLTQMLKDSLGGACQTSMIATVTPSSLSLGETSNTLHWAERAKMITLPGASVRHEYYPDAAAEARLEAKMSKVTRSQRSRSLTSLEEKHEELASKLAAMPTTRSRKRPEASRSVPTGGGPGAGARGGAGAARITQLEQEVKRLKSENQKQRTDFEKQMHALKEAHTQKLKERDIIIDELLSRDHRRQVKPIRKSLDQISEGNLISAAAKPAPLKVFVEKENVNVCVH